MTYCRAPPSHLTKLPTEEWLDAGCRLMATSAVRRRSMAERMVDATDWTTWRSAWLIMMVGVVSVGQHSVRF